MASVVKKLVTSWVYEVDAKQLIAAEQKVQKLQKSIISAISASDKLAGRQNKHFRDMSVSYNKLTSSLKKYKDELGRVTKFGTPTSQVTLPMGARGGGGRGGGGSGRKSLRGSGGTSARFGAGGLTFMGFGLAGAVSMGVMQGMKTIIGSGAEREGVQTSFGTMLKSEAKAQKLLDNLNQLASKTPFKVQDVRDNARRILGAGFDQKEVVPMLKQLGDLAQGDSAVLRRMVVNLSEIKNNDKASIRDIRQFSTAGIDIMSALSKVTGQDKKQIGKMISNNQITFKVIKKALDSLTGKGGIFYKGMDRKSQTLGGKFSNLQDNLSIIAEQMGGGGLNDVLKSLIDSTNAFLGDNKETIVNMGGTFLKDVGTFAGSIIPAMAKIDTALGGVPKFVALFGAIGGMLAFFPTVSAFTIFFGYMNDLIVGIADINSNTFTGFIRRGIDKAQDSLNSFFGQGVKELADKYTIKQLQTILDNNKNDLRFQKGSYMYGLYMRAILENQKRERESPNYLKNIERQNEARVRVREFEKQEARKNELDPLRNTPLGGLKEKTVPDINIYMNGGDFSDVLDGVNNSEWQPQSGAGPRKSKLGRAN